MKLIHKTLITIIAVITCSNSYSQTFFDCFYSKDYQIDLKSGAYDSYISYKQTSKFKVDDSQKLLIRNADGVDFAPYLIQSEIFDTSKNTRTYIVKSAENGYLYKWIFDYTNLEISVYHENNDKYKGHLFQQFSFKGEL